MEVISRENGLPLIKIAVGPSAPPMIPIAGASDFMIIFDRAIEYNILPPVEMRSDSNVNMVISNEHIK